MSQQTASVVPEWRAVQFDETHHWNIPGHLRPFVRRMLGVYFYNANEVTHCCELTPSYYLRGLQNDVECVDDTPDAIRDELSELALSEPCEDCYVHCHVVDRKPFAAFLGSVGTDGEDEPVSEDDVREYWQGNCPNIPPTQSPAEVPK